MSRKSLILIIIAVVFCLTAVLWFYQGNISTLEIVKYDFLTDYKLPEYKYKPAASKQDYLLKVSNHQFEIPEDAKLSRKRELDSAQYQFLHYYLAKYAHQLGCLKYKGMKEYIENILRMEYEPYLTNPAELKKQGEYFLASGIDNSIVRFGIGVALIRMKQLNKALNILNRSSRRTVRDKNCPGIIAFYFCGRLASLTFNWYLPSKNKMVNNLSDRALAKAFQGGEIRPCDAQVVYRIIENSKTSMSFSRTLAVLAKRADFPEYFIDLLKGTGLVNKAWLARGYRLGIDYGKMRLAFLNYLKQAEVYLKKSYTARPDLPEAAGAMITVAMARRSGNEQGKIYWFNKSVRAQNDYMGAYYTMLNALYYNWTEHSNKPLIDFGEALQNCRLYNTEVPLFYVNALETIAKTTSFQNWRLVFGSDQTRQKLERIFSNYFKQKLPENDLLKLKTFAAVCAVYAGEYFKADELMKKLPQYIKTYDLNFYDACYIVQRPDIQLIEAEIELGTGRYRDKLGKVDEYCAQNKFAEAKKIIKSLIEKYSNQSSIKRFLFKRLMEVGSRTQLRHQGIIRSPLFLAVRFNNKDILKFLLDSGADANELDSYRRNALGMAASYSHITAEIMELLLKAGADLSIVDNLSHTTALHAVLAMRHMQQQDKKIRMMINYCKNFTVRGPNSLTVLDYAIHYSTPEIVELMIKKGADPDLCDNDGWSPVYRAVLINRLDMLKVLLKHKADVNLSDKGGRTALDISKNPKIRNFLLRHGAKSAGGL